MENLLKIDGIEIFPIMSFNSYNLDSKFGNAKNFIKKIEELTKNNIIHTITTLIKNVFNIYYKSTSISNFRFHGYEYLIFSIGLIPRILNSLFSYGFIIVEIS